jgi:hypothetical protein
MVNRDIKIRKTKCRVQIYGDNINGTTYKRLSIQILTERFNMKRDTLYPQTLGIITFTSSAQNPDYKWFGCRYEASHESHEAGMLLEFAKLMVKLRERINYDSTPKDVLSVLDAQLYFVFEHEWVCTKQIGKRLFRVKNDKDETLTTMVATNVDAANKRAAAWYKSIATKPIKVVDIGEITAQSVHGEILSLEDAILLSPFQTTNK